MKETGLILSTDMVQATLEDRKTHTRRTYGLEKVNENPNAWGVISHQGQMWGFGSLYSSEHVLVKCPYGQVGDRLWVKETWRVINMDTGWYSIDYEAGDGFTLIEKLSDNGFYAGWVWTKYGDSKRPSLFLPKKFSRIWLEITGIRAERLQDIMEEAAISEGFISDVLIVEDGSGKDYRGLYAWERYAEYWDSLNAKKYPWSMNPWVWPIEYRRLQP